MATIEGILKETHASGVFVGIESFSFFSLGRRYRDACLFYMANRGGGGGAYRVTKSNEGAATATIKNK
jgi:hypothetical protein